MLTSKTSVSLSAEDTAYLQYKGVFNMPRQETYDELLRAYFHHIHPIMPIIDATKLPYLHPSGYDQPYNLILLWSIFYAAVNVKFAFTGWNSNLANADIAPSG